MKQYLGDSVYIELERGMIKLTTDNGYGPNNTIFLEPAVYQNFVQYVQSRFALNVCNVSPMFVEQQPEGAPDE
jgi:hypothetical protein